MAEDGPPGGREPRPVVFLDLDGVLNRTVSNTQIILDEDLVSNLAQLVREADADIVLSTFWREFDRYIGYILGRMGVPRAGAVVGATPDAPTVEGGAATNSAASAADSRVRSERAKQIDAWLKKDEVTRSEEIAVAADTLPSRRYVVLDDKPIIAQGDGHLWDHFVQTDPAKGFDGASLEQALRVLREHG